MSSVIISGDVSGTVTLQAPSAAGSTVLTLPTTSGTVVTTAEASALTTSGNLTFTGTGNRITGDFSNATVASRVMFQSSTANSATRVGVIPSGTGTAGEFSMFNNSDPTNAGYLSLRINTSDVALTSGISGTGTYVPMTFYTNGSERVRIETLGSVGIGTNSPNTYNANTTYNRTLTTLQSDQALTFGSYYQGGVGQYGFLRSSNGANTGITDLQIEAYQIRFLTASGASGTERFKIDPSGNAVVVSAGGGLGYGTGSGGTVTQATSKSTAVTRNSPTGQITMNNAALAANTSVAFTVANSIVAATDTIIVNLQSGAGSGLSYQVCVVGVSAGSFVIQVRNNSAGSLSEALVLNFAVIKGSAS